jgi:sugar phosphate isomerase/epimerase
VKSTLRTLELLDSDRFGVCFQPYDASLPGATGAFTALRDKIWHLHFQGRKGTDICLLEEADLDYAAYTQFISSMGFDGYLCIEFVKDCVVPSPELIDLDLVMANAEKDRAFVMGKF